MDRLDEILNRYYGKCGKNDYVKEGFVSSHNVHMRVLGYCLLCDIEFLREYVKSMREKINEKD